MAKNKNELSKLTKLELVDYYAAEFECTYEGAWDLVYGSTSAPDNLDEITPDDYYG